MRMTIHDAIRALHLPENHLRNYDEYGIFIDDELKKAMSMAVTALEEKYERENPQPLTIEELRQMNGEPVWVEEFAKRTDTTGWALVEVDDRGTYKGVPFVEDRYCTWNVITRGLHCYRHKPKEEVQ